MAKDKATTRRFEARVWANDTRPADKRAKSGRVKVGKTFAFTTENPATALAEVSALLSDLPSDKLAHIVRVQVTEVGGEADADGNPFAA